MEYIPTLPEKERGVELEVGFGMVLAVDVATKRIKVSRCIETNPFSIGQLSFNHVAALLIGGVLRLPFGLFVARVCDVMLIFTYKCVFVLVLVVKQ